MCNCCDIVDSLWSGFSYLLDGVLRLTSKFFKPKKRLELNRSKHSFAVKLCMVMLMVSSGLSGRFGNRVRICFGNDESSRLSHGLRYWMHALQVDCFG